MTVSNEACHRAPDRWTAQGLVTVAFLGITAGVQMSDMGLQAISLSAIQKSFGVGDAALGALQGLPGVLRALAFGVPVPGVAARAACRRVLGCLILGSCALMPLGALAANFPL